MEKNNIDWSVLKTSMIFFGVVVALSSGLITASYYFNSKLKKDYINNKNLFQAVSRQYLDVDQEEKLLQDYYPKFVKLYNDGVIGREKRLSWIEAIRQAGEKIRIPSLSYSISSQEEFKPGFSVDYGNFRLYRSKMELTLGMLHEGDLFYLFNELSSDAEGIFSVNECVFRPSAKNIIFERDRINISANCTIHWVTINLPDGKGIEIL